MKLNGLVFILAVITASIGTACSQADPTPNVLATVDSALATQAVSFSATPTADAFSTSPIINQTPTPNPTATTTPVPTPTLQIQAQEILLAALARHPAESITNGLTIIDFSKLRELVNDLNVLNDASENSFLAAAQTISLNFNHINVVSATNDVIIFEGPLSQLDIQDVRHWLGDFGYQPGDYGGFELWRGGSRLTPQYGRLRNSGISAVALGPEMVIVGKEREVKQVIRAMVGEMVTATNDPFAVWFSENLNPGFGYYIYPLREWPSGTSLSINETNPIAMVTLHERVRRQRSDETAQYSDEEWISARTRDGYQTWVDGEYFEGERSSQVPFSAEFLR